MAIFFWFNVRNGIPFMAFDLQFDKGSLLLIGALND
jgi:hypothetical protein